MSNLKTPTQNSKLKANKIVIAVGILAVLVVILGWSVLVIGSKFASNPNDELEIPRLVKAPPFSLKDYDGNTVSLPDFSGKPLVINSWAVWCPFCIEELKEFVVVKKELGDKVVFIAIDRSEPLEVAKNFSDGLGVTDDLVMLLDPRDSFYQSIGGFSMPETIFVDSEGNIVDHKRGPMDKEEVRRRVQEAFGL